MNSWSNIEISKNDPEIIKIDEFEHAIGSISSNIRKIRELITRFEICHFRYKEHIKNIKLSILYLKPNINPDKIGRSHIKNGKNAWKDDKTGRSKIGQQYLDVLVNWLDSNNKNKSLNIYDDSLNKQIRKWLRKKNPDKERLIRLLIARLLWDWKSYEEYQHKGKYQELEYQICRMDICHYAFPGNIDRLLRGIGKMQPIEKFEGCGTSNDDIKKFIAKEYLELNNQLESRLKTDINIKKNEKIKIWLTLSLAKTLKEQIGLKKTLPEIGNII